MPLETKKVLWTVISIAGVLVVASGLALALFLPQAGAENAPASIAGAAPPRAQSPDAYMRQAESAPVPAVGAGQPPSGTITIIYGDKPASDVLGQGSGASTPASATEATQGGSLPSTPAAPAAGSYTPAPPAQATPSVPKPAPAAPVAAPSVAKAAPKTAAKTVTVTEYWVQAGSFSSRSRADDLQRDLAAKGLSSIITLSEVDGKSYYRVRIGPYATKAEADGWVAKVKTLPGCDEAYVSMKTVKRES